MFSMVVKAERPIHTRVCSRFGFPGHPWFLAAEPKTEMLQCFMQQQHKGTTCKRNSQNAAGTRKPLSPISPVVNVLKS